MRGLDGKEIRSDERILVYTLKKEGWSIDEINNAPEWIVAGCMFIGEEIHKRDEIELKKGNRGKR